MQSFIVQTILILPGLAAMPPDNRICTSIPEGTSWLDLEDPRCRSFYSCKFGVAVRFECAFGAVFSENDSSCGYADPGFECNRFDQQALAKIQCEEGFAGNVANPGDETCSSYVVCYGGSHIILRCPPHQIFDPSLGKCDIKHQGFQCSQVEKQEVDQKKKKQMQISTNDDVEAESLLKEQPRNQSCASNKKLICYFQSGSYWRKGKKERNNTKLVTILPRTDGGKFTMDDLQPLGCTHVVYQYAELDANCTVVPHSRYLSLSKPGLGQYKKVIKKVKGTNKNIKVLISIGGWLNSHNNRDCYKQIFGPGAKRERFIE